MTVLLPVPRADLLTFRISRLLGMFTAHAANLAANLATNSLCLEK